MKALVLIVEDNATTRKLLRLSLQSEGYRVIESEDGEGALRQAAQHPPQLVVLDCRLPDIDGIEVSRRLRRSMPDLPIVALTGWAQSDEGPVLKAGFSDVLIKPVEPSRLIEVIERHIGRPLVHTEDLGKTVLLVDDNPFQRKIGQLALANAGLAVVTAESGEAALALARKHRPDVIVSDVLMPGMDGFHLCQEIHADPVLAGVPIILASAHYLKDEDRALAARFGASRYVARTAGFDSVVCAVIEALESPAPELTPQTGDDLEHDYLQRVLRQLERQAAIATDLDRRTTLQATALSVLDGISDALARQLDPEQTLGDTLAQCLDAAGLSVGAILLRDGTGRFSVRAHVGSRYDGAWPKFPGILERAMRLGSLIIPSPEAGPEGDELLGVVGVASALIVGIIARDETIGALVLASNRTDLAGTEGSSFVRAARSVSMQLGQAIALSRMVHRLVTAEQRYRALLENANDAIGVLSPDGVMLEANRRWEEIVGVPRAQLIGHRLSDLSIGDSSSSCGPELEELLTRGSSHAYPTPLRRANENVMLDFSRTEVEIGGEKLILTIARDVTERVRLTEQLRQSQKMEAVGRLAGGVAHDFNNLLSVILSYGSLMLANLPPDDPMRGDVREIQTAGQRAAELTRQLLMFSRQQVLEPRVVDLNELLTHMEKMLTRIVGEDVELNLIPFRALGRVMVDPGSMEQVIMNLVVNARDAMPRGGKLILETANVIIYEDHARSNLGAKVGPHVMVAVSDNGIGMDQSVQARIFEPFFTTKEKGKGTGLGLSTVFGIVQQSGGHILVQSERGKGATFKIFLPQVDAEISHPTPPSTSPSVRGTETILLVEDEDQVRTVTRGILRGCGYRVLDARSPGEALKLCEKHDDPIHLLLSDVVMPQMSGPELARRIAEIRPGTKLMCMSGHSDDTVRQRITDAHIAFLQKPITVEALTRKVREVLDA